MKSTLEQFIKEKQPLTVSFRKLPYTNAIQPYGTNALRLLEKMRDGDVITVIPCGVPRDPLLLRKFHKMIDQAYKNIPEWAGYKSKESFRKEIIIKAGYYEPFIHVVEGQTVEIRKAASIALEQMDEYEFRELFEKVHIAIIDKYGAILPQEFLKDFF